MLYPKVTGIDSGQFLKFFKIFLEMKDCYRSSKHDFMERKKSKDFYHLFAFKILTARENRKNIEVL